MILFDEIVNRLARQKALALAPEVCGDQLQISKLGGLIVAPVLQFLDKSAIIALTNSAIQFGKVFHTFFILLFALFVIFFCYFFLFQLLIRIPGEAMGAVSASATNQRETILYNSPESPDKDENLSFMEWKIFY